MSLLKKINSWHRAYRGDDTAAVTVDWVVLCAGVAIMVGIVIQSVSLPMGQIADVVSEAINESES